MMVSIVDSATFKLDIGTANTNSYNLNLRTLFETQYPYVGSGATVEFTVLGNIGSTSTSTYSLETGSWPAGSNIKLILPATSGGTTNSPANGIIAGKGGSASFSGCCDQQGQAVYSEQGGPAILLSYPLTIQNSGIIGSGGTGGHGITQNRDHPTPGDGGGGAGIDPGYSQARGRNYRGAAVYSSYLVGGESTGVFGGNLGSGNGYIGTSYAIVAQGNALTVTGSGQLLGGTN
jgi:hypothetical protein